MVEIETYGCAVNQADSEAISGILTASSLLGADVTVVNTCTVKSPTESKILRRLRQLKSGGRKVVVAGCIPAARPAVADEFPTFSFIGVNSRDVAEAVRCAQDGRRYVNISTESDGPGLPCIAGNPLIAIVQISAGCLGSCSYCQTKLARGNLKSFRESDIKDKVEHAIVEGAKEVWLTSQDTGAYGLDIKSNLPSLLSLILSLDGDFRVRVGMMNPNHALRMLDDLVEAYMGEKVYKFLHLPVQSGDDGVLKDMNRLYTVGEFREVVSAFSKLNVTLSTDVIVGYPTETKEAFENTLKLIEEVKPDVLNVTRYWPRPGTRAAGLKPVVGSEVKCRSRLVNALFKQVGLERNSRWVGWKGKALISEVNPDGTFTARNDWYKPIVVEGGRLGEKVNVNVIRATYYDLRGETT